VIFLFSHSKVQYHRIGVESLMNLSFLLTHMQNISDCGPRPIEYGSNGPFEASLDLNLHYQMAFGHICSSGATMLA
jgi:hypothetical protein